MLCDLKSDLFIIPYNGNSSIIYSPLRGAVFQADHEAVNIIKSYLENGFVPTRYKQTKIYDYLYQLSKIDVIEPVVDGLHTFSVEAVFILSQICNLGCSYCYAKAYHSEEILPLEKIMAVVDSVIKNSKRGTVSFSFLGGGEPFATWDLLKRSIDYIVEQTKKCNLHKEIGVATNGTLLNYEKIHYLKENDINISVSFDIIPKIQDSQRPFSSSNKSSFEIVNNNIRLLIANGVIPKLRSTITKQNVYNMPEMVEFVADNYSNIKLVHLEPVTDINENNDEYYQAYADSFRKARKIAKQRGIFIKNSITHSFNRVRTRFCNGELCITPNSDIVSCHRISSQKDVHFQDVKIGTITHQVNLDIDFERHALEIFENKRPQCATCFAKWHCAGGCTMFQLTSSEKEYSAYCAFVKNSIRYLLEEKINCSVV